MTLQEAIEAYNLSLQAENKSPRTIATYNDSLQRLATFVGWATPVTDLTSTQLREWIVSLQKYITARGKPLSPHTIGIYVSSVKSFLSWCEAEGLVDEKPRLKAPKTPKRRPQTLSDEEIKTLLRESQRVSTRVSAIVSFLLDTGCRATEVCNMLVEDVDLSAGTAIVRQGKGKKDRMVQFGPDTARFLRMYLRVRRRRSKYLFATYQGGKLKYETLRQIIRRLGKRVNLPNLRLHTFRHTFATAYLAAGGSVAYCQKLMGHENITTTMGYVNMAKLRADKRHISVVREAILK